MKDIQERVRGKKMIKKESYVTYSDRLHEFVAKVIREENDYQYCCYIPALNFKLLLSKDCLKEIDKEEYIKCAVREHLTLNLDDIIDKRIDTGYSE